MAREYGLPPKWLNRNAAAFLPDAAQWIAGPEGTSSTVRLADLPTLAAMKMAAERTKDIEDLGHIVLALGIEQAEELMRLAFGKYGEHSVALSAPVDNYEIVAEEAMAAARALLRRRGRPTHCRNERMINVWGGIAGSGIKRLTVGTAVEKARRTGRSHAALGRRAETRDVERNRN